MAKMLAISKALRQRSLQLKAIKLEKLQLS
jgi:hypothetical protein